MNTIKNFIKNFIKNIFDLFGYTIVNTIDYDHTNWEVNHYKTAYEGSVERSEEFHKYVANEIFPGWNKSDERNRELIALLEEAIANWQKTIELNDKCIDYINNYVSEDDDTVKELKQNNFNFNKAAKEGYRHQLADMGIALDRLMGELVSAHGYTEKDIAECLGYYSESYGHDTPLYEQVQKFMPPFDWKYAS